MNPDMTIQDMITLLNSRTGEAQNEAQFNSLVSSLLQQTLTLSDQRVTDLSTQVSTLQSSLDTANVTISSLQTQVAALTPQSS